MANSVDYAQSFAAVPLGDVPFDEVDALVLATLVYMPLGDVTRGADEGTPLGEAARALLACGGGTGFPMAGAKDRALLSAMCSAERFGRMRLMDFEEHYDERTQEQFAAATFLCGQEAVIAFRGTDATIVGWKEDFDMSFKQEAPAQRSAVAYAQRMVRALHRPMRLCGHSKGGNLAAYAALFSDAQTRASVTVAYSFDGPGFNEAVSARLACTQGARLRTFVPQGSLVGMLLWHSEPFTVVRSDGIGIFQHDPYTWRTQGSAFVPAEQTAGSRYADATIKEWLSSLPPPTRKKAIDGIYEVISAAGEKNLAELLEARNLLKALESARALDAPTREAIEQMLRLLGNAAASTAPDALRDAAERFGEGATKDVAARIEEGRRDWMAAGEKRLKEMAQRLQEDTSIKRLISSETAHDADGAHEERGGTK